MEVIGYSMVVLVIALLALPWLVIVSLPLGIVVLGGVGGAAYLFKAVVIGFEPAQEIVRKRSILIADDDEISVLPLLVALNGEPVKVTLAQSGAAAIRELRRKKFDFVFLDMLLPDYAGGEILENSDAIDYASDKTPVIIYSGFPSGAHELKSHQYESFEIRDFWDKAMGSPRLLRERLNLLFAEAS